MQEISATSQRVSQFLSHLEERPKHRILVIGDVMFDYAFYGDISRDPLAHQYHGPSIVFEGKGTNMMPGGAAFSAAALSKIFDVDLFGVIGDDAIASLLASHLPTNDCRFKGFVDPSRPTTLKIRWFQWHSGARAYLDGPFRIDVEARTPISQDLQDQVIAALSSFEDRPDAVLLSDYSKGMLTPQLVAKIRSIFPRIPFFVDPKYDSTPYRDLEIDFLLLNEQEAHLFAGYHTEKPDTLPLPTEELAEVLMESYPLVRCFVVKLGSKGSFLLDRGPKHSPVAPAVFVRPDPITPATAPWGAGCAYDAFFAATVLHGLSPQDAAVVATAAASVHVSKPKLGYVVPIEVLQSFFKAPPSVVSANEIVSKSEKKFLDLLERLDGSIKLAESCPNIQGLIAPEGSEHFDVVAKLRILLAKRGFRFMLNAPSGWGKSSVIEKILSADNHRFQIINTPFVLKDAPRWSELLHEASRAEVLVFDEFDKDKQSQRFLMMFNDRQLTNGLTVSLLDKTLVAMSSSKDRQTFEAEFPDMLARFDEQTFLGGIKGDVIYIMHAVLQKIAEKKLPKWIAAPALRDLVLYDYVNNRTGHHNSRELEDVAAETAALFCSSGLEVLDRDCLPERVRSQIPCRDGKLSILPS